MSGSEFNTLQTQATKGDPAAQLQLGLRFAKGEDCEQDYKAAAKWLSKAASAGLADAQFMLGALHQQGRGV